MFSPPYAISESRRVTASSCQDIGSLVRRELHGISRIILLERNFVVEVVVAAAPAAAGRGGGARGAAEAAGVALVVAAFAGTAALAAAARGAVEHRQFAAEFLQHDLGRVFFDAGVVGPFARLQGALDIDLGALAQVFLGDRDEVLVEDHDAVPLGALLALAGIAVAPALRGRQVQIGDAGAVIGRADLGVAAEIADENHLVDAASHGSPLIPIGGSISGRTSYQARRMFLLYSYPRNPQGHPAVLIVGRVAWPVGCSRTL